MREMRGCVFKIVGQRWTLKLIKLDPYKTTLQYPSPNMNPKTTNNANGPEDGAGSQLSDDREDERRQDEKMGDVGSTGICGRWEQAFGN